MHPNAPGYGRIGSINLPRIDYYDEDDKVLSKACKKEKAGPLMEDVKDKESGLFFNGSAAKRRMRLTPLQDALEQDGAGLDERELDTKTHSDITVGSSKRVYNRVFGNTLYEEAKRQLQEGERGQQQDRDEVDEADDASPCHADAVTPHTMYTTTKPSRHSGAPMSGAGGEEAGFIWEDEPRGGMGDGGGAWGGNGRVERLMTRSSRGRAAQAWVDAADNESNSSGHAHTTQQKSQQMQTRRNNLMGQEDAEPVQRQASRPMDHHPSPLASQPQHACRAEAAVWEGQLRHLLELQQREDCVHRPGPGGGALIRCYIKRSKEGMLGQKTYRMFLESGDLFLLAARLRKKTKNSHYVISADPDDLKRDTDNCLAKLKANYMGSQFTLWQRAGDASAKKGYGQEAMSISFESHKNGPRALRVALPVPGNQWEPSEDDSLAHCLDKAVHKELPEAIEGKLAMMCNRLPTWDNKLMAYTLNFDKRVKMASVKNLQLVSWDHSADIRGGSVILQFGKLNDDTYALDFGHPFTIESAFAVGLATLDTKLCFAI